MKNTSRGWLFKAKYRLKDGTISESKNWYIGYWVKGKQVKESISPDKRVAESVLYKRLTEIKEEKYFNIKKKLPDITFDEIKEEVIKSASKESERYYKDRLKQMSVWFSGKCLKDITPYMIQQYVNELKGKISNSTINGNLRVLKRCFNLAIEMESEKWEAIIKNPVKKVKFLKVEQKERRLLSIDDFNKLLANSEGTIHDIILFAGHTGARITNITDIKWEHIDFKEDVVTLIKTKGNKIIKIPMDDALRQMLFEREKNRINEYVFNSRFNTKYANGQGIRKEFKKVLERAKLTDVTPHRIRHFFGTLQSEASLDLSTLKDLMGHSDIKTTMIYSQIEMKHKRLAMARYGDILSGKIVVHNEKNGKCDEYVTNEKSEKAINGDSGKGLAL